MCSMLSNKTHSRIEIFGELLLNLRHLSGDVNITFPDKCLKFNSSSPKLSIREWYEGIQYIYSQYNLLDRMLEHEAKAWFPTVSFFSLHRKFRAMKLIALVSILGQQPFLISLFHFLVMKQRDEYQKVLIFISVSLLRYMSLKKHRWSFLTFFYVSIFCIHNSMILIQNHFKLIFTNFFYF